jgi:hypothetical protein
MLTISVIIPDPSDKNFVIKNSSYLRSLRKDNSFYTNDTNDKNDKNDKNDTNINDSLWLSSIYEIWETKDIFYDINTRINNFNSLDIIREGIRIIRDKGDTTSKMVCDHFQMILELQETKKQLLKKMEKMHETISEKIIQLQIDIENLCVDIEDGIITHENVIKKIELIDIEKNLITNEINILKNMGASEYDIKILTSFMKGVYNELSKLLTIFHIK